VFDRFSNLLAVLLPTNIHLKWEHQLRINNLQNSTCMSSLIFLLIFHQFPAKLHTLFSPTPSRFFRSGPVKIPLSLQRTFHPTGGFFTNTIFHIFAVPLWSTIFFLYNILEQIWAMIRRKGLPGPRNKEKYFALESRRKGN
jgi:hypothetical protein